MFFDWEQIEQSSDFREFLDNHGIAARVSSGEFSIEPVEYRPETAIFHMEERRGRLWIGVALSPVLEWWTEWSGDFRALLHDMVAANPVHGQWVQAHEPVSTLHIRYEAGKIVLLADDGDCLEVASDASPL